jgi:ubiquinone/menaquinone biosynthesis C-methylase UbiE
MLANLGYDVLGCDSATEMLAKARIASDFHLKWAQLDVNWFRLPFSDDGFGAVVASSVLEYVADPALVLAELARVLRPDGFLLATVPASSHPVRRVERVLAPVFGSPVGTRISRLSPRLSNHATYLRLSRNRYSGSEWSQLARRAGLTPVYSPPSRDVLDSLMMLTLRRDT